MPYHSIIDRIQLRMIKLFGTNIFPNHTNQSLFKPIEGFVAVGVGPLNYDPKFVEEGLPDPKLNGDMLFLAERMRLKGPPLHIAHVNEKRIFNQHMADNPKPSSKTWEQLAEKFKDKSDYVTVFPKLPSMLRSHFNDWKATQQLVTIKNSISLDYYGLLKQLGKPPTAGSTGPAAEHQKQASDNNRLQQQTESDSVSDQGLAAMPDDPMPVPPLAAHTQTEYNVSGDGDGRSNHTRKCSAAPFGCPNLGINCSKSGWRNCKLVKANSYQVTVPDTEEERKSMIDAHKKEQNRLRKAATRRRKRQQQQQQQQP